jgi:hypothetical protein
VCRGKANHNHSTSRGFSCSCPSRGRTTQFWGLHSQTRYIATLIRERTMKLCHLSQVLLGWGFEERETCPPFQFLGWLLSLTASHRNREKALLSS